MTDPLFEANALPMWIAGAAELRLLDVNRAARTLYGHRRTRMLELSELDLCVAADRDAYRRHRGRAVSARTEGAGRIWRHRGADGGERLVRTYASLTTWNGQRAWIVTVLDVSGEVQAQQDLHRTRSFLDVIIDNIPAMLFVKDAAELRFVLLNKAAETQMCCSRGELIGRNNQELLPPEEAEFYDAIDREVLRSGSRQVSEAPFFTKALGERIMRTTTIALSEDGAPRYLIGICDDVTDHRANERRIAHLAHHDALTDLPNRVMFCEGLETTLASLRRHGGLAAVLCIDLDNFKDVNDSLGHSAGDALLREVAMRLRSCLRAGQIVSRQGGDEFTVLLPDIERDEDALTLANQIIAVVSEPFHIHEQEVVIGASVGIAVAPGDGMSSDLLLRNADMALYRAKADGRGGACFFQPAMDARLQVRRQLERDLRKAFATGELELYYQPLLTVDAPRITGFEALLRWRHTERGFVSPAEFIPVAEEIGLITPIGDWVLRSACREAASWPAPVRVAVNVSALQFRKDSLLRSVAAALEESGLDPQRLELEITESVLMHNTETNLTILNHIRALGVRVAMDDFGTGYSSLSYLRAFPFDKIKIDRSFVHDIGESRQSAAIVRAVTSLGTSLGITTTAEGVETTAQLERLRMEGCDELQGFLFSRPVPAGEARAMLVDEEDKRQVA